MARRLTLAERNQRRLRRCQGSLKIVSVYYDVALAYQVKATCPDCGRDVRVPENTILEYWAGGGPTSGRLAVHQKPAHPCT